MSKSRSSITEVSPGTFENASVSSLSIVKSLALIVAIIAIGSVFWVLRVRAATVYPYATPERIFQGIAHLPFQYRVLTALIVRLISGIIGISSVQLVFGWMDLFVSVGVFLLFYYINKLIMLPLWGVGLFVWAMMANYVYLAPVNYMEPYDMPAVVIFCAGILAIYQRKWLLFYTMLFIGMLNRETAALLTCGFIVVEYDSLPRVRMMQHIIAQASIIISIKVVLYYVYKNNGGVPLELYVQHVSLGEPSPPPSHVVQNIGYLYSGDMVPLFGGVWLLLVGTVWFIKDRILRRLMWLIPIELGFMMLLGRITEFRLFNECVPLVALGTSAGISGLLGRVVGRGYAPQQNDRTAT